MNVIKQYPYSGRFYRKINITTLSKDDFPYKIGDDYLRDSDGNIYQEKPIIVPSAPTSEKIREVDLLVTDCDITEASDSASSKFLSSKYVISIPFIKDVLLKRGDQFESDAFGLRVNGEVLALFPSQLGVKIYLSDIDN